MKYLPAPDRMPDLIERSVGLHCLLDALRKSVFGVGKGLDGGACGDSTLAASGGGFFNIAEPWEERTL